MKEDLENDLIEDKDACDDVKNDSKSSHVYLTQPSDDLNSYMVNKFHPPMAKSKHVPHESIDLSVYKPSAKCLGFTTSECRLLHWITTFGQRYHSLLTGNASGYKVIWKEQDNNHSASKCDKIVINLRKETASPDELLVVITVFLMTGRILVQGKGHEDWSKREFPALLDIVNQPSFLKRFSDIPSVEDKSIFTGSVHNFVGNFVPDDDIPSLSHSADIANRGTSPPFSRLLKLHRNI